MADVSDISWKYSANFGQFFPNSETGWCHYDSGITLSTAGRHLDLGWPLF